MALRQHTRSRRLLKALLFILVLLITAQSLPSDTHAAVLQRDNYWEWIFQSTSSLGNVSGPISRLRLDGREVFCVQVEMENATGDIYPDPIPASLVYAPDTLNRLGLITLFGFELTGKTALDIAFTKLFVYEAVGYTILGLTDTSGQNVFTMEAYQAYKANIEAKIAAYMSQASFHGQQVELSPAAPVVLTDTNGVLDGYRVLSAPDGVTAVIDGATLRLSATAGASDGTVYLQRTAAEQGTSLLYQPPGRQHVIESKIDAPRQSIVAVSITQTGGLTLIKEARDGTALGDAEFSLTAPDGSVRTLEVPASGLAIADLVPGTYTLRETKAPAGYRLSTTSRTIIVTAGQAAADNVVRIENDAQRGTLRIIKQSEDGQLIAGARFEVSRTEAFTMTDASGETNEAGELVLADLNLAAGTTYFVRETFVPYPYAIDAGVRKVELRDGQTSELVFANQRQPWRLEIVKTDREGRPIEGVVYQLSRDPDFADAAAIIELVTAADGKASASGSQSTDAGVWYVREHAVPAPFILNTAVRTVTLAFGETAALDYRNDRATGMIHLQKNDALTGEALAGAVFRIRHADGLFEDEGETGGDGRLAWEGLPLGAYEIVEMNPPLGYVRSETVHHVSLDYADAYTDTVSAALDVVNQPIRGRIRLLKTERGNGEPIAGASFLILREDGTEAGRLVTDDFGRAESDDLLYGRYTVREMDAPESFYVEPFTADAVIDTDGQLVQIDVTNERVEVRLLISKTSAETDLPLAGAVFEVIAEDGSRVALREDPLNPYQLKTDETGRALADLALQVGTYRLVELTPPNGYATAAPQSFTISRSTSTIRLESGARLLQADVTDHPTILDIAKIDADGTPLSNALLMLSDTDGQVISVWHSARTPHRVTRLTAGKTYILSELSPPAGHAMADPYEFSIEDTDAIQTIHYINAPTEMLIDKRDRKTNEPLPGIVFEVWQNGRRLSFESVAESVYRLNAAGQADIITDADGIARIQGVLTGAVEVREARAPGYRLDESPRHVQLTSAHSPDAPLHLEWFNEARLIHVLKADAVTGLGLSGAVFRLNDAAGNDLAFDAADGEYREHAGGSHELTGDANGRFVIAALKPGDYVLSEIRAPLGYLPTEPIPFSVTDTEEDDFELIVTNRAMTLPATGEDSAWPLLGTLFVLNGAGLFSIKMLIKERRAQRKRKSMHR